MSLPKKRLLRQQGEDFDENSENRVRIALEATLAVAAEIVEQVRIGSVGHMKLNCSDSFVDDKLVQATRLLLSIAISVDQVRGEGTSSNLWSNKKFEKASSPEESLPTHIQGTPVEIHILRRVLSDALLTLAPDVTATGADSFDVSRTAAFRELNEAVELLQSELCMPLI